MYENGSLVTLINAKSHGEGEDAIRLSAGICGIIVGTEAKNDNNHLYTIDFGAYGQWYCFQNELSGDNRTEPAGQSNLFSAAPSYDFHIGANDSPFGFLSVSLDATDENKEIISLPVIDVEKDIEERIRKIERGEK